MKITIALYLKLDKIMPFKLSIFIITVLGINVTLFYCNTLLKCQNELSFLILNKKNQNLFKNYIKKTKIYL